MVLEGGARARSPRRASASRWPWSRVTFPYELVALAAWIAVIALTVTGAVHGAHPAAPAPAGEAHHHVTPAHTAHGASDSGGTAAFGGLATWALMCAAMMLPAALPALAHVGTNSLRRCRQRAMAGFAAVYLAVWTGYGALLLVSAPLWSRLPGDAAPACALALAAAWQSTAHKRRALRDCHRSSPLPLSGPRAVTGTVRFGLRHGGACLRSCWALMAVMTAAGQGTVMLAWMALLTGLVTAERFTRRPGRTTRLAAAALAAAALTAALAAVPT
ncbi:copper chaperone [Streptomyces erythrochromogenes]|uniref:copper chaperone n=1 Tax=Streptomyces erythrochromogenes TaxID=285574 RepID=UPI0036B27414